MTSPQTGLSFENFLIEADKPEEVEAAKNILDLCFEKEKQAQDIKVETAQSLSTRRARFARLLDLPTE